MVAGSVRRGAAAAVGRVLNGFRRERRAGGNRLCVPLPPSRQGYVKGQIRLRRCL
jgi:hypothetical protein